MKYTLTSKSAILQALSDKYCCAYCRHPLPLFCIDCSAPKFSYPTNQFECAQLKCLPDYRFVDKKFKQAKITPECYSFSNGSSYWYVKEKGPHEKISQLSCKKLKPDEQLEVLQNNTESTQDLKPFGVKANHTRKNPRNRTHEKHKKSESGSGDWLRKNWISSILTPLIILAVIGGCIVFLVFVLKTKDEQDNFLREERRRERKRRGNRPSATDSSGSEEALV